MSLAGSGQGCHPSIRPMATRCLGINSSWSEGGYLTPVHFATTQHPHFIATCVHTRNIRYVYPQRFPTNYMPGFKTIGFVVPALLAVAGTSATPFQKRGLDQVISQCKHNFAYASSLFPISHSYWYRAPTTETNPKDYIVTPSMVARPCWTLSSWISSTVSMAKLLFVRSIFLSVKNERSLTVVC